MGRNEGRTQLDRARRLKHARTQTFAGYDPKQVAEATEFINIVFAGRLTAEGKQEATRLLLAFLEHPTPGRGLGDIALELGTPPNYGRHVEGAPMTESEVMTSWVTSLLPAEAWLNKDRSSKGHEAETENQCVKLRAFTRRILQPKDEDEITRQALDELSEEERTIVLPVLGEMKQKLLDTGNDVVDDAAFEQHLATVPDDQRIPVQKLLNRIDQLKKERGVE